jgi:hypothetical protein
MQHKKEQTGIYSSVNFETIFLKSRAVIFLQLPFDQSGQLSDLEQLTGKNGFQIKNLSKKILGKQVKMGQIFFVPPSNSNYLLTEKNDQAPLTFDEIKSFILLLGEKGSVILLLRFKEVKTEKETWYDRMRILAASEDLFFPPFHTTLDEAFVHSLALPFPVSGALFLLQLLELKSKQPDQI